MKLAVPAERLCVKVGVVQAASQLVAGRCTQASGLARGPNIIEQFRKSVRSGCLGSNGEIGKADRHFPWLRGSKFKPPHTGENPAQAEGHAQNRGRWLNYWNNFLSFFFLQLCGVWN